MNPFRNELKKINKENDVQSAYIESRDNYLAVQNMVRYLSSSSLSLFQIQIIRKDLIGIALEGEKEGLTLQEKLGVAPKEFCDDIIRNGENNARREHLLNVAVNTLQYTFLWLCLRFFFFESTPMTFTIVWSDVATVLVYYLGGAFLASYIRNKLSIYSSPVLRWLPHSLVFFLLMVAYTLGILFYAPISQPIFTAENGYLVIAAAAVAAAAASVLANIYWRRCAKRYMCDIL